MMPPKNPPIDPGELEEDDPEFDDDEDDEEFDDEDDPEGGGRPT